MTVFVTWPPFTYVVEQKGGQVTKPIMHGCEIAILLNYRIVENFGGVKLWRFANNWHWQKKL